MFSRKFAGLFLSSITLLGVAVSAQAQENTVPLIIVPYDTDTNYVYENGQFQPMDFCQPGEGSSRPTFYAFAPDSAQVAFQVAAPGDGLSTEVYLCDLTSREARLLGPQPDSSTYRSAPVWSPDGTQLAWADSQQDTGMLQIMIYDLATASAQVIYEQPYRSMAFLAPSLDWGQAGLGFYDVIDQNGVGQPVVFFIDPASGTAQTYPLADSFTAAYGRWINTGDSEAFLLRDSENELTVMNPETGEISALNGRLEFYNRSAPQGLSLLALSTAEFGSYDWVVNGPDFSSDLSLTGHENIVALSPDGQQLAFTTFENYPWGGRAYIVTDFTTFPPTAQRLDTFDTGYGLSGALSVFWGPVALRLHQ